MSYQIHIDTPYDGIWIEYAGDWEGLVAEVRRAGDTGYPYSVYEITREIPIEEILG